MTLIVEVLEAEFFPFLAWRVTSVAQQSGISIVVFCTSKCATHFQWETGLDCRQASLVPALVYNEAKLLFGIVLLK